MKGRFETDTYSQEEQRVKRKEEISVMHTSQRTAEIASIKPQGGVQDVLRIRDHRTVGKASNDEGQLPEKNREK